MFGAMSCIHHPDILSTTPMVKSLSWRMNAVQFNEGECTVRTLISMIVGVCLIGTNWAQEPEVQRTPHPKIQEFVQTHCGEWAINGRTAETPAGPSKRWTGKMTARPILDGFAVECAYEFNSEGSAQTVLAKELLFYDPLQKKVPHLFVTDEGVVQQGEGIPNSNTHWKAIWANENLSYRLKGLTVHVIRTDDGEKSEHTDIWHRVNK